MSTETNNLKLKKPHIDDYMADTIKDIGDNMDIIDEYLESGQTLLEAKDLVVQKRDETVILAQQVANNAQTVSENMQTVLTKAGEALSSAIEAERQAGIAANNILNGISTHNTDITSHPSILSDLTTIEALARGKNAAKVFETVEDMNAWLAVPENVVTLSVGDSLYIRDINVPNYWWDGEQPQILEAQAINLSDYYTKQEVDARLPIAIEQTDYDALVAAGTVIAGRIYYVVPDGTLEV